MPIVTLPDGKEISFPDGMGVNDIAMALMPGTPAGDFIGTLPSESGQPYNQIGKPYAIYNDLKAKRAREYTHETYQNPYEGVPESFAYGVYESPGELARLGETVGSVSLPGMVANMLGYKSGVSDWVDEQTGVNEMGYDPKGYPGRLQQAAKFGGNVVGDPLNAIPGGYLAGKFGKELGGEIVNQAVKPSMSTQGGMVGYHGSPHKFDKFDHSKMGTGEGAQAYGWGTYIAENPDTAKFYRDSIGKNNLPEEWRIIESPKGWEVVDVEGVTKSTLPTQKGAQEYIVKNIGLDEYAPNLYEIDLPDEKITQMLDWDAPLSEQPESVRAAINSSLSDDDVYQSWLENGAIDKIKGGLLYNRIVDNAGDAVGGTRGAAGSQQAAASQKLKELGIPGIKYFDGSSRSAGEGTRNFVVFDENDMSILSRNGEKTLP